MPITDLLGDLGHRLDVHQQGPAGTVGTDSEIVVHDLPAQPFNRFPLPFPGAGEPDVGSFDTQAVHQVEDFDLVFKFRIGHRRGLQAVPQGLVVQHDAGGAVVAVGAVLRPVVDQALLVFEVHALALSAPLAVWANSRTRASSSSASAWLPSLFRIIARW